MKNKFLELRDSFSKKLYPAVIDYEIKCWNFYTNSTEENMNIFKKSSDILSNLYNDKNLYKEFKNIKEDFLTKNEKRQLKLLLKNFKEELESGEDLKELRNIENEISKKYNNYKPKINGKLTTKPEITKILEKEKNPEKREKAYLANIKGADLIAEDLLKACIFSSVEFM